MSLEAVKRPPDGATSAVSRWVHEIHRHCPGLVVETATLNLDGQYNAVLIVNERLVFRFAKVRAAARTLRTEVAVQRSLRGRLPLSIPNPIYVNVDEAVIDETFVGYSALPGVPLWRKAFNAIQDRRALARIAAQLAGFLRALHGIAPESIEVILPRYETRHQWADMFERVRNDLFPFMRESARASVAKQFDRLLVTWRATGPYEPRLRHGDFGTGNILHEPVQASITGVIDFGHVGLGDPAYDFAGLLSSFGEDFYARCADSYPAMVESIERAQCIRATFGLEEALFGYDNADEAAFRSGMAPYI